MPTRALVTHQAQHLERFPDTWHRLGVVAALVVVVAYPALADARWMSVANLALVSIVGSTALMILTGFCGQVSLGHAAFLALGAYTAAVLGEQLHLPFWLGLPAGGLVAAFAGLLVGPFALRLRGLYLALVTLGLVFLVNHVLLSAHDLTHGISGIAVPMHVGFGGADGESSLGAFSATTQLGPIELDFSRKLYAVFCTVALLTVLLAHNLRRSRLGRAMMAVRDSDLAASALGVNPARTKVLAFGISSFLAGVAGAMFAFQQQYITIEPPFDLNMSVQYIAMIVLGGIGTVFGAVAGALAFVFLTPLAQDVGRHVPFLSELSSAQQSTVLFCLVVAAFLIWEPLGLFGIWLEIKRYFLTWPFSY